MCTSGALGISSSTLKSMATIATKTFMEGKATLIVQILSCSFVKILHVSFLKAFLDKDKYELVNNISSTLDIIIASISSTELDHYQIQKTGYLRVMWDTWCLRHWVIGWRRSRCRCETEKAVEGTEDEGCIKAEQKESPEARPSQSGHCPLWAKTKAKTLTLWFSTFYIF